MSVGASGDGDGGVASGPAIIEMQDMNTAGLGYGIAVAVGILVMVSTVMLASYVCVRVHGRASSSPPSSSESAGRAQGRVARPADSSAIAIDDVAVESYSGVRSDSVVVVVDRNNMLQSSSSFSHDSASFRYGGTTGGSGNVGEGGVHDWSIGSGLDEATLESFPKFCYSRQLGKLYISGDGDDDSVCSICLAEYCDGDVLRMLPDCRHSFHASCVDAWLRLHASCPMCRCTSTSTSPMPTPLSELIPLARHPLHGHNYR